MKKKLFKGKLILPIKSLKSSNNKIGQRLRIYRKFRCMTLAKFGEELSTSQGSLSDLENGNSLPSSNTLVSLYYSGCDINWLLSGEEQ